MTGHTDRDSIFPVSAGLIRIVRIPALIAGFFLSPVFAEEARPEWFIQDGEWRARSLGVRPLFQINVDGRSFIPVPNSRRASSVPASDQAAGPNEIVATFDGKPVSVNRVMKFDPTRNAIRVLDILSNSSDQDREVRVSYYTSFSGNGSVRLNGGVFPGGETREYGQGVPDNASGAIVLAERSGSDAVPLILWGQRDAKWAPSISDFGSSLKLDYQGTVPRAGKVALLHWIAVAGLERGVKLEQSFDRFFKSDRLIEPLVPSDAVQLVANFKPEAFQATTKPGGVVAPAGRLVVLEALCKRLGITRIAKDSVWVSKESAFDGDFTAKKIAVESRGKSVEFPVDSVAALRGGAGRGRPHLVFLRDGTVIPGKVVLDGARLDGELGSIGINADALELLVMRGSENDGRRPEHATAFAQRQGGEFRWLSKAGDGPVEVLTAFGQIRIPSGDLKLVERRREAPFDLQISLKDGSRFRGVWLQKDVKLTLPDGTPDVVPVAELERWGDANAAAGDQEPDGESKEKGAPRSYVTLKDGSVLAGNPADKELRVLRGADEVKINPADVRKIKFDGDVASLELAGDRKLRGTFKDATVAWQSGAGRVNIATSLLTEWVQDGGPMPKAAATPEANASGVNRPEALPAGFREDQLIEISPDYPKAMFISTPISASNYPNLEKPDNERAKRLLKFKVPRGASNVAKGKKVASSDPAPIVGTLDLVTDGDADGADGCYVELAPGPQWIQIDLGARHDVWKILLWHFHKNAAVYHRVVVQVSDDPAFHQGAKTIFNNDAGNKLGFGAGKDPVYVETNHGRLIDGMSSKGRYVRFYSDGSSGNEMNHYIEVMIFGTEAK